MYVNTEARLFKVLAHIFKFADCMVNISGSTEAASLFAVVYACKPLLDSHVFACSMHNYTWRL